MSQTKETKELLVGFLKLSNLIAVQFKDGLDVADIAAIFTKMQADPVLTQAIRDSYEGIDKISAETKEMGLAEAAELLAAALPEIVELIKALKK